MNLMIMVLIVLLLEGSVRVQLTTETLLATLFVMLVVLLTDNYNK